MTKNKNNAKQSAKTSFLIKTGDFERHRGVYVFLERFLKKFRRYPIERRERALRRVIAKKERFVNITRQIEKTLIRGLPKPHLCGLGGAQSCRVLRSNSGQAKNSSKLMLKPSQIAYKVFNFTEVLRFFLIEESVVCGTPLRVDNSYFVMFRSMHNCSMRNATASSKSMLSPPLRIVVA